MITHPVYVITGQDKTVEEEEPCGVPADIAILIDSSRSIDSAEYALQMAFVKDMVSMFDIGQNTTHIAALTFAARTKVEFYFGQYETSEEAKERVC